MRNIAYLVLLLIVLIISGCGGYPMAEPVQALGSDNSDNSKYVLPPETVFMENIPARVNGIVVDTLPRLEGSGDKPPVYRIVIEVHGTPGVYPVDVQTWVRAEIRTQYQSGEIVLDCDPLPCVIEGGQ